MLNTTINNKNQSDNQTYNMGDLNNLGPFGDVNTLDD